MTPDPENDTKKRPGRPKGAKNKGGRPKDSGIALRQQRKHGIGLSEHIRDRLHPELIEKYYLIILGGATPLHYQEDGMDVIIPDPNPLLPAPTLEQRNAAMKALIDRGYGLPSQSITVDHEYKNKVELQLTGLSSDQFAKLEAQQLQFLRDGIEKMFKLRELDIVDAELVDTEETKSPLLAELTDNSGQ